MAGQHGAHDHDHNHEHGHTCANPHHDMESYSKTDVIVSDDIMAKANELAQLISTTDEVLMYQKAEKQVSSNSEIQDLIKLIKKRQKEVVAFERFQNQKMIDKINGELEELQDKLDDYPIVAQFKQTQEDINYLLQLVVGVIRDTVSEKIQVEEGSAEPASSCSE